MKSSVKLTVLLVLIAGLLCARAFSAITIEREAYAIILRWHLPFATEITDPKEVEIPICESPTK